MNTAQLKEYAPKARRDFIKSVMDRAAYVGLTHTKIEPLISKGDVAIIGDKAFPQEVVSTRTRLEERITRQGFEQTMEAMAYTWFNRLVAIRYMELHGYLEHGYRVLSHPEGKSTPEILEHAEHLNLPGLDKTTVIDLKLDGTKENELYRMLLIAQCNALHQAMPFLFEKIGDETELLLPANLLHTDSLIRQLVEGIDESAWQNIEIIGWLYQFYISEKKKQVIGKVVKSEDIPAATQLFTPNWIVKYMVQNSLGAQWLATYPDSTIKEQMEYYIEPAEQTDEVNAQLAAITPTTLNSEELTLIDPASGSGHILVEAYELFKAIYLERGYRKTDVAKLILEKNLFGLDIDERAAQLTGFALMMKGRADDRQLFERGVKLNVMALVDSGEVASGQWLVDSVGVGDSALAKAIDELFLLFEHATTFGSLIQVPEGLAAKLPALKQLSEATSQDLFVSEALKRLGPLVQQAQLLAAQYDAVVANPPYMGGKFHSPTLKKFAQDFFPSAKNDLFACFIERGFILVKDVGHNAMVTMENWMFLSSYEKFRTSVLQDYTLRNLAHFPYDGKRPTVMGINFGVAIMSALSIHVPACRGHYFCSRYYELNDYGIPFEFPTPNERLKCVSTDEFKKIPGSPVAYWVSCRMREVFEESEQLGEYAPVRQGLATADNDQFMRSWPEVSLDRSGYGIRSRDAAAKSGKKWFPYNKGGEFRKWFGNNEYLVNWESDGRAVRAFGTESGGRARSRAQNAEYYFRPSVTWSFVSSSYFGVRYSDAGAVFDVGGSSAFPTVRDHHWVTGLLCSKQVFGFMKVMNPTLNFQVGNVASLPVLKEQLNRHESEITIVVSALIGSARKDWNSYERSWDFQSLPLLSGEWIVASGQQETEGKHPEKLATHHYSLATSYSAWITQNRETIAEMKRLEEVNNHIFIDAYGLADELTPDVPIEQITLTVNPAYRYGKKVVDGEWTVESEFGEELEARFRQDTMAELISYAIGCMMGRYSLDKPGLIYAHSGNQGFDFSQYQTFPADEDGIIPITDYPWFEVDAGNRVESFIATAWPKEHLEENIAFIAESLGNNRNEHSRDTIRRYLANGFYKHHLSLYKKRPIYWLFSSGKQRAFQCLVYLHRYNEGTLSRMRTEYVIPLLGKMAARIDHLDSDISKATSTSHGKKLEKEKGLLRKQQTELQTFDEQLRHYANQRITLDLDDGVKVNYGKFGNLLAEVKKVTGGTDD